MEAVEKSTTVKQAKTKPRFWLAGLDSDDWFRTLGPIIVLGVMIVIFTILDSRFMSVENWLNVTRQGSVLLVVAMAGTFVILMGSVDLSVASVVTMAAIVGAVVLRDVGSPWLLLLVPVMGLALGAVNGLLFAWGRLPSFLVTLGTLFAFDGLSLFISRGTPISLRTARVISNFVNGSVVWRIPNLAIFALIVTGIAVFVASRTRFGRYMYAIGDGERVALLSGVPVRRYKLYAFMVSGMLAAVAGLMLMFRVNSGSPSIGQPFLLTSLAAIVMGGTPLTGGVGGPHRTLLGVLIVTVLTNGMAIANIDPYLQIVVQGTVVILAVALTLDRRKLSIVK
jgi:ribose transport system permease protein/putative xylitol transport system permease protein